MLGLAGADRVVSNLIDLSIKDLQEVFSASSRVELLRRNESIQEHANESFPTGKFPVDSTDA